MQNVQDLHIKELDPELIPPSTFKCLDPNQGGCKTVIIGKPGTGKTTLITSLLHICKIYFTWFSTANSSSVKFQHS